MSGFSGNSLRASQAPLSTSTAPVQTSDLNSQLGDAAQAVRAFTDTVKQATQQATNDAGGVAQPQSAATPLQPVNQFTPLPSPPSATAPLLTASQAEQMHHDDPMIAPYSDAPFKESLPEGMKRDRHGRVRDLQGRYISASRLDELGVPFRPPSADPVQPDDPSQPADPSQPTTTASPRGGLTFRQRLMTARQNPMVRGVARAALAVGRFAFTQAGATSINQSLQGLPLGGLIAGSLGKLEELGMKGAGFELSALQAGATRGQGVGTGYATANSSYVSIKALSSSLGVSPSAAASMLRDVGVGTQGELTVDDITGLTVRGFDAAAVSSLGSQMTASGVGNATTALQIMGVARAQGLSNTGVMSFTQAVTGFATGRRSMGLDMTDASSLSRRARSMILPDETRPSLESNLATLGRFQSVGVNASKGLSGFTAGMTDMMLQAYAFEKAGGDVFKATALLEKISDDPVEMRKAMQSQGASDEQVDVALLGTGQLTTTDIRRGQRAGLGERAGRMRTSVSTGRALAASKAVAEKGQRDLEQLYGASDEGGESVVSRFNTLLKAQTRYQAQVLKKMPTSGQINKIVDKLIGILEATDFLKAMALGLYGRTGQTPRAPLEKRGKGYETARRNVERLDRF